MKAKKSSAHYNRQDAIFKSILISASLLVVGLFVALFSMLISGSMPSILGNGFGFLTGTTWDPGKGVYGALPAILTTIATSLLAVALAVPIALGIAIFFTEYAPEKAKFSLTLFIDLLAAIPSVIFGIWGLWVIAPLIKTYVQQPIVASIGFIPIFGGPAYGISLSLASLILAMMVVPIIASLTIEIISRTPVSLKEGMISLGATKWETVKHVSLPFARLGILAAVMLGLGRALGETMAITMVIGNSYMWPFANPSIFAPATSITSKIASEFYEATSAIYVGSLIELSLILLVITLVTNVLFRYVIKKTNRGARRQ